MKLYDDVKVINDRYENIGIKKGSHGAIVLAEIREHSVEVEFFDLPKDVFPLQCIDIADLEVTHESAITDEDILDELPSRDKRWWCKVENGYIVNLLGEKKNKIPYDYNS